MIASLLAGIWLISWFLMIWIGDYRWQLFFTGLFAFILVAMIVIGEDKV